MNVCNPDNNHFLSPAFCQFEETAPKLNSEIPPRYYNSQKAALLVLFAALLSRYLFYFLEGGRDKHYRALGYSWISARVKPDLQSLISCKAWPECS